MEDDGAEELLGLIQRAMELVRRDRRDGVERLRPDTLEALERAQAHPAFFDPGKPRGPE